MDFASLLTSTGTSFLIFVVLLLLYVWLASKQGNKVVYYSNRLLKGKGKDGEFSNTPNPFRWLGEAWQASEDEIIAVASVDAVVYLIFLATCMSSTASLHEGRD